MPVDWLLKLQTFAQISLAIFLEASPFLVLGSLLSALIEVLVDQDRLAAKVPKNPILGVGIGLVAGMAMPTCECGVVPIARRLLSKGVPPHTAMTYMLAAPVINPVVLASTYIAFQGRLSVVLGRALLVALTAAITGFILGRFSPDALLAGGNDYHDHHVCCDADHSHHDHCAMHGVNGVAPPGKLVRILTHTYNEFLDMGKYLLLGCFAAAAIKVVMPWEVTEVFKSDVFLSVGFMMALAVLLSVCSEADAFVAASFVGFPVASQLAFMAIGPMVDLKLVGMYYSAFQKRTATILVILPCLLVLGSSLIAFAFWGGVK
jgi:uncharacterized membrane protein YraQ (UPF0718 family)